MIRLLLIFFLFLLYGNFSSNLNNIVLLSLINIAFYSILKNKNLKFYDYSIFIFNSFLIEVIFDVPLFFTSVILIIPILFMNYIINNFSFHRVIKVFIIFFSSLITLVLLNNKILLNFNFFDYVLLLLIMVSIFVGLVNYGRQ